MDAETPSESKTSWKGRPAGLPSGVPPPSVPLSFLGAAVVGLIACGIALLGTRHYVAVNPADDHVVGAAHLAMLATLSMGVLGAIHQFTPVITKEPLRSVRLSRATFLSWVAGSWLLPIGFITQHEPVVEIGGGCAALAVALFVVNMAPPLSSRAKGAPVMGLRLAVVGFVATACYGVVYVIDRRGNWFNLNGHVVLAHACIGLLAWLGLTYLSVSEKLWPMFMLAHVPGRRRSGWVGIWSLFVGVVLLSPGLLVGWAWLAVSGSLIVLIGLGAHLFSLVIHVQHRRRAADLHLWFVVTSAAWLVVGAGLGFAGTLVMRHHHHLGVALIATTICALSGWLLVALVGHSYKIVPFIIWSALRARGTSTKTNGAALMFSDLYNHRWSTIDYALVNAGIALTCFGMATSSSGWIGAGGILLVATGVVTALNLAWRPIRLFSVQRGVDPVHENLAPITSRASLRARKPTTET